MNCVPDSTVDVGLTWGLFAILLLSALRSAESVANKMAESMGRQRPRHFAASLPSGKFHCLLLVTVAVLLTLTFCAGEGLFLSGLASLASFVIAGSLEYPEKQLDPEAQNQGKLRFWAAVQKRLDPGVVAGFLSQRLWSTHFVVLCATVVISAIHLGFFGHLAHRREDTRKKQEEDEHVVSRMFSRSLHMACNVALWTSYAVVVLREVSLVSVNEEFGRLLFSSSKEE